MQQRQIEKYTGQQPNKRQVEVWRAQTPTTINETIVQRFGFDNQKGPMTKYSQQAMCYRTMEHHDEPSRQFSIIKAVLAFFAVLTVILILIDFKNQKAVLVRQSQLQIQKCQQHYQVNQCQTPTFNLQQQCFEWNKCRHRKAHEMIKTSAILFETVGSCIRGLFESAGITIVLVVVGLIAFKVWQTKNDTKHK